jgi:hypothetical protein
MNEPAKLEIHQFIKTDEIEAESLTFILNLQMLHLVTRFYQLFSEF